MQTMRQPLLSISLFPRSHLFSALFPLFSTALRDKLEANTKRFREAMLAAGFDLGGSKDHPIIPIMLGDAKLAGQFAEEMLARGIYVVGFSYPVVPKGKARIRTQISAAHSTEDIDRAVKAFIEVKNKLMK